MDDSKVVDLADTIMALQIVAGVQPSVEINKKADINDGKIGIPEAVFSLQKAAG